MDTTDRTLVLSDLPRGQAAEFNFDQIIDTVREFIASAPSDAPFNICLSGDWGSGKTTLLSGLEAAFAEKPSEEDETKYVTIWFDPWKLSSEEEVRNALARAVLKVIEDDADFATRVEMSIERRNVIRMLSERLFQVNADDVNTFYQAETRTRNTFVEVEEIFRRVAAVYLDDPAQPRRLVIFVDDLDRCRPERVTDVLESVKLFFDLPGLTFVFALDNGQLERAVASDYKMERDEARVYLEKIFQLKVDLPRKEATDLRDFLASNLKRVGVELGGERLYSAIIERYGRNLRNLKLFVNWFSFHRQLIGKVGIHDEEALFRWLYLESTMKNSMDTVTVSGLSNLALALEFLAHGGFMFEPETRERYLRQLETGEMNYVAMIVYSIIAGEEEDHHLSVSNLDHRQRALVEALRADGAVVPTLKVIREGSKLFIDTDLTQMIYLARSASGAASDGLSPTEAPTDDEKRVDAPLATGSPLSAQDWNRQGDKLISTASPIESYLCYLIASLMEPTNAMYLCDVARSYRRANRRAATQELQYQAYSLDPTSVYVLVEIAHFYDITVLDEAMGSLLYRRAIGLGTPTPVVPWYLGMNLQKEGNYEDAYFAYLDAAVRDPESEAKLERLAKCAREAGWTDRPREDMKAELIEAIDAGIYPRPLSPEEEQAIQDRLTTRPDEAQAAAELSRPPI